MRGDPLRRDGTTFTLFATCETPNNRADLHHGLASRHSSDKRLKPISRMR
jgi:hypothetical protein